MTKIKITFLGTGGVMGIPVWNCNCLTCNSSNIKNKRLRPSLLVQINDKNIIIDMGQDLRRQLIDNNIKYLNYAFLTHAHGDHINGREQLSTAENIVFEAPEDVLGEIPVDSIEWLKKRNKTIKINCFSSKNIEGVKIDTIKLKHEKDFGNNIVPCYGYLFLSESFKFAYMSDFNEILEPEKLYNLDLIISDGSRMEDIGIGHMGIKRNINEVLEKFKPKKVLLTHIHHSTEHEETNEYLKKYGNIELAYDGLTIDIEK